MHNYHSFPVIIRLMMKLSLSTLSVILLWAPALAASAAPPKHAASSQHPLPASSQAQVDGIISAAVDKLWEQSDVYWHHGDYPRIIALDRIITQADPHFLEPYETGGWLMESMGNYGDAEAYYRQGVQNNAHLSEPYYHLGFFYFNTLHDYPKAVQVFREDTQQSDTGVNDWKMLAHSYEHTGDIDQAAATWQHIKARWPHAPAVDANLNRVLALQQKQRAR